MGSETVDIVWHCPALKSAEYCVMSKSDDGWTITGEVVTPIGKAPGHIEYTVSTNERWETRQASVVIHGPLAQRLDVEVRAESWTVDGVVRSDLAGCVDIDLGFSPATNTLPIRRLDLGVGQSATTKAAWFTFPELVFMTAVQRYERVGKGTWRYVAGASDFVLEVDSHGRVIDYGGDLWKAAV